MLNIGLTGGIGSGKSAASAALHEHGATIVDADLIARDVVAPGTEGLELVVREFGKSVITSDGALDRAALAAMVFADESVRNRLNQIVHPRVRARSAEMIEAAGSDAVIVNDIPLLAEGSMAPSFHLVVVVTAPEEVRLRRLVEVRGMDRHDALARIRSQATDRQRQDIADVVLENDGSLADLHTQIEQLWTERLAPFSAAMELGSPATEHLLPRAGAIGREFTRLKAATAPHQASVRLAGTIATVRSAAPGVGEALARAGWFGAGVLRSADPGAQLAVQLVND